MDINNNQQVNTFVKGMNTDVSDALMDSSQYRYAENVRLVTNTDSNSGELRLIEGTSALYLDFAELIGAENKDDIKIIYFDSIRNYIASIIKHLDEWYICVSDDCGQSWNILFGPCSEQIWNEDSDPHISGVLRWESENNIKLYFADDTKKHAVTSINIDKSHWESDQQYTEYKDLTGYKNQYLQPASVKISEGTGSLAPGRVQYVYRLYRIGGGTTTLSIPSQIISIQDSETKGNLPEDITSRAVDVSIDIDQKGFDKIQIYRVAYVELNQNPKIYLIKDEPISQGTYKATDTGEFIESISNTEFEDMQKSAIYPTIIESKNDYLFAAGISYDIDTADNIFEDVDVRSVSSGNYWKCDGVEYAVTFENGKLVDLSKIPSLKNAVLCHRQFPEENGDTDYDPNNWLKWDVGTNSYQSTAPGGTGYYVDWEYVYKTEQITPNSNKVAASGLRHDETYRYGMVLYDNDGRHSSVKWIADIRMPNLTDQDIIPIIDNTTPLGSRYNIKTVNVKFTVKNLPPECKAFQIVRCDRKIADSRNIMQGIIGKPLCHTIIQFDPETYETYYVSEGNYAFPSSYISMQDTLVQSDVRGDIINTGGAMSIDDVVMFASPEYAYQPDDVKNEINSTGSVKLKHQCSYNIFSKNSDAFNNDTHAYDRVRMWTPDNDTYGFRWKSQLVGDDRYRVRVDQETTNTFSWDDTRSLNRDDGGIYYINNILGATFMTFNHAVVSSINQDQQAYVQYPKIKATGFPATPKYNKFSNGDQVSCFSDITSFGDYSYTSWSIAPYGPRPVYSSSIEYDPLDGAEELSYFLENGPSVEDYSTVGFQTSVYYPLGFSGRCILFQLEGNTKFKDGSEKYYYKMDTSYGDSDTNSGHILPIHIANLLKTVYPYGGYNKQSINNSIFRQYGGASNNSTGPVDIILNDADSCIGVFQYSASHLWDDPKYIWATKCSTIYTVPIETNINLSSISGDTYDSTKSLKEWQQEEACGTITPVMWRGSYSQNKDEYLYNTAYSSPPIATAAISVEHNEIEGDECDVRVYHSNLKTNGELIDNWLEFKSGNYIDVDTRFGKITQMSLFKDKLIYWQENAIGVLSVNDRTVIQSTENDDIIIGSGELLNRYDYISTIYGMKSGQFADTQSTDTLYWWDGHNKEILAYSREGSLLPLSTVKNINNYIRSNEENKKPFLQYDVKYKELISSVVNNESVVYSEQIQQFTSIYKFMPLFGTSVYNNLILTNENDIYKYNDSQGSSILFENVITPLIQYVVNKESSYNKVFDISTFGGRFYGGDKRGIDKLTFTFKTPLKQLSSGTGSKFITNREYDFRLDIPRNANSSYGDRMRGKTMQCELKSSSNSTDFSLQYIITKYRMSWS